MMNRKSWRAKTRDELAIEVWEALDCESVGTPELKEIQRIIEERFGRGAVESPAAIARTLADEGAVLRHPEVLEFDSEWRIEHASEFSEIDDLEFSSLESAALSLYRLELWRTEIGTRSDGPGLKSLLDLVSEYRRDVLLVAGSKIANAATRAEAREIALWMRVWLEQPDLFADWLSLRSSSPEFLQKFGDRQLP